MPGDAEPPIACDPRRTSWSQMAPLPDTVFGDALNISKCKGYRDCVEGC